MTTKPEPLVLTDASGDTLEAYATPAGSLGVTVEEDERATVLLDRNRARDLFRWLAAWLGEHEGLALQPDVFAFHTADGYLRTVANRTLPPCPRCGHEIPPGAFIEAVDDAELPAAPWAHEHCEPLPPAVSKTAITGDDPVTGEPWRPR